MGNNLRDIIKNAGISQQEIAKELNIKSLGTVSLKVNGKANWSTIEAMKLKRLINDKTNKNYTLEDLFPLDIKTDEK